MNSSHILLYIYKKFFNVKNANYSHDYSQHITKLLANDVVLKYIHHQVQALNGGSFLRKNQKDQPEDSIDEMTFTETS